MKKSSPPQGYSVNRLSELTGADRRTINKAIEASCIQPVDSKSKPPLFALADVEAALGNKGDAAPLREQKLREEIRKLRIANDAKENKSELRSVTVARIQKLGHDVSAYLAAVAREKPSALAMTPEDIPRVRIELQKVTDEILRKFQTFADHWGVRL